MENEQERTAEQVGFKPPITEAAIQAAIAEQMKQGEAIARMAQLDAWQKFNKDHPIAARKAKQRAEEEARRYQRVSLAFGKIQMPGRE